MNNSIFSDCSILVPIPANCASLEVGLRVLCVHELVERHTSMRRIRGTLPKKFTNFPALKSGQDGSVGEKIENGR
jgi:hypothetical protein